MTQVEAKTLTDPRLSHPPRRLRNYLLEPRFQLKYSGMVIAVTVAVAAVLGYQAYRYSTGQTELQNLQLIAAKGDAVDARFIADLERYAREADRRVLYGILSGIAVLALALGVTGIVVTHRLVGPAYRLKRMLAAVTEGRIQPAGSLRKHDELQDVFEAFQRMLTSLRAAREQNLRDLDEALEKARSGGVPEDSLAGLQAMRERIGRSL
jgi:methyl-accepting chemotaxis protein